MTRLSGDERRDGFVWNGFDYALQVWVLDGVVERCGHPLAMARWGPCCAAFSLAGHRIDAIPGAERRRRAPSDSAVSKGPEAEPRTEV